jgi:tRNA pseudouridine55 synthase
MDSLSAVVVIDKPLGLTSFDVVAEVRRRLGVRRVGHAGTLDPLATGILVVCIGPATKIVNYLMGAEKLYRATARLGMATDTDDADPQARVVWRAEPAALLALDEAQVRRALQALVGEQSQRPPRFSALKQAGQRLYTLARAERQADEDAGREPAAESELEATLLAKQRTVRVAAIELESLDLGGSEPAVTFTVRCGKGTYIRSLARDLGEALGVGAHLTALRRLQVGSFDESAAVAPSEVASARRFTLAEALAHLPPAQVAAPLAQRLRQGQVAALAELGQLFPAPAPLGEAVLPVFDPLGGLVAILESAGAGAGWRIARGF